MSQNRPKINLLQKDFIVATKFRHLGKISLIALVVYIALAIGVFAFYFLLTRQRISYENKNNDLVSEIESHKQTEGLLVTLKDRIAQAKGFFSSSVPNPSEVVEKQIKLLPPGSEVLSLSAKEDGKLTMLVRARNSQEVSQFFKSLRDQKPTSAILSSLILSDDGGYTFAVEISQ